MTSSLRDRIRGRRDHPAEGGPVVIETPTERQTPDMRLVDAGWTPPTEALRLAIVQRDALRSAVAELRKRETHDANAALAAVTAADPDAIVAAVVGNAITAWLDNNCWRPDSELSSWSSWIEGRYVTAIYDAPEAIVASLEGIESDDATQLRAAATFAATPDPATFSADTHLPARRRPPRISFSQVMFAR